jgi:mannose-binding lectin 2
VETVFIFAFLCFTAALAESNSKDYLKREYSLIKPYSDDRWDFIGSTIVSNNYVRLTSDVQSQQGAIWCTLPCSLHDWEVHVHFRVHGHGAELFGDGFAIWYTKHRLELGPVFGGKDYFVGLAVFLDTYANQNGPHNHGHPYISAMVNNGSFHYDHDRDGTHTELAGCEAHFRQSKHETFVAIRYEKDRLTVSIDIDGENKWKSCFNVDGVRLPTGYYFGMSAATGELSDNHDIISMKLYDIGTVRQVSDEDANVDYSKIEPSADFFASPRDHVDDPKRWTSKLTGWKMVVFVIVGLIAIGVCVMIGYIVYSQTTDRRRLY